VFAAVPGEGPLERYGTFDCGLRLVEGDEEAVADAVDLLAGSMSVANFFGPFFESRVSLGGP
jgi:hypothetical protein